MKKNKNIIAMLFFLLGITTLSAQKLQSYVQFNAGKTFDSYFGNGYLIRGEYGKSYKWLSAGISLSHNNTVPSKEESAVISFNGQGSDSEKLQAIILTGMFLHVRFDIVEVFIPDCRHSFDIGGRIGYANKTELYTLFYDTGSHIRFQTNYFSRGALNCMYGYDVSKKIKLGIFYEYGGYSSEHAAGISICHNF